MIGQVPYLHCLSFTSCFHSYHSVLPTHKLWACSPFSVDVGIKASAVLLSCLHGSTLVLWVCTCVVCPCVRDCVRKHVIITRNAHAQVVPLSSEPSMNTPLFLLQCSRLPTATEKHGPCTRGKTPS